MRLETSGSRAGPWAHVDPPTAIPDAVPIIGQIDDALVVRLAMKSVAADLDAFMAWETVKI